MSRKKSDPDEIWVRQNATPDESATFWKGWCDSQWGMPTFNIMRQCVMAQRAAIAKTGAA